MLHCPFIHSFINPVYMFIYVFLLNIVICWILINLLLLFFTKSLALQQLSILDLQSLRFLFCIFYCLQNGSKVTTWQLQNQPQGVPDGQWSQGQFPINTPSGYQVTFLFTRQLDNSGKGFVAIDDVSFTAGNCRRNYPGFLLKELCIMIVWEKKIHWLVW